MGSFAAKLCLEVSFFPSSCAYVILFWRSVRHEFGLHQGSLHYTPKPCKWWCPFIFVEKAPCFKWLQNGDLLRSPVHFSKFTKSSKLTLPSSSFRQLLRMSRAISSSSSSVIFSPTEDMTLVAVDPPPSKK